MKLDARTIKMHQKKVLSRRRFRGDKRGHYWLLTLECRHVVRLPDQRGSSATITHCEKCSLGLVAA